MNSRCGYYSNIYSVQCTVYCYHKFDYNLAHVGTDEKAIISVVAYRSNAQRQQIKEKFKAMYGKVSQKQ